MQLPSHNEVATECATNKYARNGTEKKRQASNTREQTRAHP